jgi:glutamate-ammonia-ligase adenylyltransferase
MADEIRTMRERLEASRSERDVKRGFGGIVDVEFLVQLFQLKYGRDLPLLRTPSTWEALGALRDTGLLAESEFGVLWSSYNFLRMVESRLRIVHNYSLDELPENLDDLEKLARRLGYESALEGGAARRFLHELEQHTAQTREVFLHLMKRERGRRLLPQTTGRGATEP